MNPSAILALLSDLYEQLIAAQAESKALREQFAQQADKK